MGRLPRAVLTGGGGGGTVGRAGGGAGAGGAKALVRADGEWVPLPGRAAVELAGGDRVIVETPGGGGYGPADPSSRL